MTGRDALRAVQTRSTAKLEALPGGRRFAVSYDDKGKLTLPELPAHDDLTGLCDWLTEVFALDRSHPITSGRREGLRGPDGHVHLSRIQAPPIRFEPASKINTPARLVEVLSWQMLPTDEAVRAFKAEHCREIAYVIRMLTGLANTISEIDEVQAIVSDLLSDAEPVEGHTTYGTPAQRYSAATALRRAVDEMTGRRIGLMRYLIDLNTGEYVISVSDLQETARRHVGSTLPRGWLNARMETLGWARITLDGHEASGRAGRSGPHARIFAFRGLLPAVPGETVTT